MTGFGKGEASVQNKKISVEIRSLNSKQLDLNLKLPSIYRRSEYDIRNLIAKGLLRGKVDVFVNVETAAAETSAHINREAFTSYVKELSEICKKEPLLRGDVGGSILSSAMMLSVMRLPDVVSTDNDIISDEEHTALISATEQAIAHLDEFRLQEGATLIADLLKRVDKIEGYKQEVIPFEKARTETIRARIFDTIAKLQVVVDSNRMEQEMIFYMEKLDITEEKVRLTNHCNYFREVAAEEDGSGRKLGFITQEMGREINTLGSKANESNMQILVVKMKDELEKIKEQVLNIL
ncbi:MAG: YicC/YloC family endoribonuclease [Alistipes sp.]